MIVIDKKPVAQGDMLIQRIDALPKDAIEHKAEHGEFIVTHSESGHHHVVRQQEGVRFYEANDNTKLIAYLVVKNPKEVCFVEHKRDYDTHAPMKFKDGIYRIRRQIESGPEGWRRAVD